MDLYFLTCKVSILDEMSVREAVLPPYTISEEERVDHPSERMRIRGAIVIFISYTKVVQIPWDYLEINMGGKTPENKNLS